METIRSSREIDRVFSAGQRHSDPLVLVISAPIEPGRGPQGRVAFIAGKKLGGAVVRSRAKRILRAAAQEARGPWEGRDVLLVARPQTLRRPPHDVATAINRLMRSPTDRRQS